jgi:hypothetical protein
MMKYLVILFVFMMAELSWAQSSAPSKEWLKTVKEVVTTSDAWAATNGVVPGGISPEMLNDKMWEDVLFGYPSHIKLLNLKGGFVLLDGKNTLTLPDTVLSVWVTDISVPFYIPPGVDVEDPKFLVPIYDGQKRIIKSYYDPSGQGQDALAEAKSDVSADVSKLANVQWVVEDSSFIATMNGREYLYQKNSEGQWESEDPDAPKAIKAGDRKKDPTFIFSKNAEGEWEPTASNKRNGYKFGMGDYAGYRNNYYRYARNGAPLGSAGAWGIPIASGFGYAPMMGGGWNAGWGFGGGFSVGLGWGNTWGNSFGCMPYGVGMYDAVYDPYHWAYWGMNPTTRFYPTLYNPQVYTTSVVNNYWFDGGGYGDCKSADAAPGQVQQFEQSIGVEVASLQTESRPDVVATGKVHTLPSSHSSASTSRGGVTTPPRTVQTLPSSHTRPEVATSTNPVARNSNPSGVGTGTRTVEKPVLASGRNQNSVYQAERTLSAAPVPPSNSRGGVTTANRGGMPVARTGGGVRGDQPPLIHAGSVNRGGTGFQPQAGPSRPQGAMRPQGRPAGGGLRPSGGKPSMAGAMSRPAPMQRGR